MLDVGCWTRYRHWGGVPEPWTALVIDAAIAASAIGDITEWYSVPGQCHRLFAHSRALPRIRVLKGAGFDIIFVRLRQG